MADAVVAPATAAPEKNAAVTQEIEVNGKKVSLTAEEMRTWAQKAYAADNKFQEAAQMKKDAQQGLRIKELTKKLDTGLDAAEMAEYAQLLEIDPATLEAELHGQPADTKTTTPAATTSPGKPIGMDQLDPQVQEALRFAASQNVEQTREKIKQSAHIAVDKDEVLGKILGDKTVPEDRKEAIRDLAFSDVQRRILAGETYGTDMVQQAVLSVRRYYKAFGIPGAQAQQPVVLGLGPSSGLPTDVSVDKDETRVPSTEVKYEESAVRRFTQMAMRRIRGDRNG
jgi:hypothetical protein